MAKITLTEPVGDRATLSFRMQPDRAYRNGEGREKVAHDLLAIPNLATCTFQQAVNVCQLGWKWAPGLEVDDLVVNIPELPGPEPYLIQYTWDARKGRFDGYVNGNALRLPDTELPSWTVKETGDIRVSEGPFQISDVRVEPRYLDERDALEQVPEELHGRHAVLFGVFEERTPLDIGARLGSLLYESTLDRPESLAEWVVEGPGILTFKDGWMEMASERPDGPEGHIVYWCPHDFPDRFVAEWEVQPVSEYGLCIVFFAARGENGEDIFDESLPERNGVFTQYTNGAVLSYHLSYYANTPFNPGRITCNMRKNNNFYLVTNGPPGIPPGSQAVHRIRLIKDGARIQLQVDGRVIIDYTDDGRRYGPVYRDGKIALRQTQWMVAKYRNFCVYSLND